MIRATRTLLVICALAYGVQSSSAQSAAVSANLPAFEAATIKPPDPGAPFRKAGFYGEPGGRIFFGGTLKMLVWMSFNLAPFQVTGGPDWTNKQWFEINAVPPDNSQSRKNEVANAEPTPEQRLMLQALLRDRFGFRFRLESKEGEVYILTRGRKPLRLEPPKNPQADPRAIVIARPGGYDGQAVGTNTTTGYLAKMLSRRLQLPVVDQTGINGSYDFDLPATDSENQDVVAAVLSVVDRLGLAIKRGRGPIQTLVIDQVAQPSEN